DREKGTITIVFQTIGASTKLFATYEEGDSFMDFVGPLGRASELCSLSDEELKKKKIIFMAGGVGTAPVYPQAKYLHERGVECDVIIGARNASLIILAEQMKKVANVYITTDDGTLGRHGNVNDCLKYLINEEGKTYDLAVAIGPLIMMKFAALLTKELNIPTVVSMNPIMVDGTGMCGACRIMVGGEVKFACVDGPEFDGHLVDFDGAMMRQRLYKTEEGRAVLREKEGSTHHGGCGNCGEE
ncbi:MAG: sulfide/dihydroorotate dehydrogenase-like FAD/NAD-binding protein, partial [Lachnospiraceae bacterium]|nr:sulfide/dihydroorotate dehydrogenase-like FAD/NAD-binding protein [Lachnospiraceae bacterium]